LVMPISLVALGQRISKGTLQDALSVCVVSD